MQQMYLNRAITKRVDICAALVSCGMSMQQMYLAPSCIAAWLSGNVASVSCHRQSLP